MFTVENLFYGLAVLILGGLALKLFGAIFSILTVVVVIAAAMGFYAMRRNGYDPLKSYAYLKDKFKEAKTKILSMV